MIKRDENILVWVGIVIVMWTFIIGIFSFIIIGVYDGCQQ